MLSKKQKQDRFKQLLSVTKFLTLYLVQSNYPHEYLFADPLNNYFRLRINKKIQCSCLPGNQQHCLHSLYLLTKIFQISDNDSILKKRQFTTEDLNYIFYSNKNKGSKSVQKKQKIPSPSKEKQKQQKIQIKEVQIKSKNQQIYHEPNIQQDSICSICHDILLNDCSVYQCNQICHNYFHTKCLRIWINHQKKQQLDPSCPMCRNRLSFGINEQLKIVENQFIKYYKSFQINCCQCQKQIIYKLYKCLLCKNANVCQECYSSWKHQKHDRFLIKNNKKQDWGVCIRNQASMAKIQMNLKYIKQFKNKEQIKVLFGPNYQKFLQQNIKKQTMLEYLINSLTSVHNEILKTYKKLQFQEKDIKCIICRKGKITKMRRLTCKHFIDQNCLKIMLVSGYRTCPLDKSYFLPAFQTTQCIVAQE